MRAASGRNKDSTSAEKTLKIKNTGKAFGKCFADVFWNTGVEGGLRALLHKPGEGVSCVMAGENTAAGKSCEDNRQKISFRLQTAKAAPELWQGPGGKAVSAG